MKMQLSDFIGKKLTDIGVDEDTETLFLEFTGGHKIHVQRSEIKRTMILARAKETTEELEERRAEVKKARAEANAAKTAKATKTTTKKSAKKTTKKATPKKKASSDK